MKFAGVATFLFGLLTAAVGLWRHLETGNSPQAVWFGAVMGAIAVAGALLLFRGRRLAGGLVAALALAFVGGWFLRRVITGHEEGLSARVVLILAACAAEAAVLLWMVVCRKSCACKPPQK